MGKRYPVLAREGWAHIIIAAAAAALATWLGPWWVWLPAWSNLVFVLQFFRDPDRQPPAGAGLVLSAADGKVVFVGTARDPYLERDCCQISVFMNVFSVHSNRAPVAGEVRDKWYKRGRFINAALDKASEQNERQAVWLRDRQGRDIVVVQVAGLIARRILCYVAKGDALAAGERYGFIRFGSRVDIYLPASGFEPRVSLGDKVTASLSVLGEFPSAD